MKEETDGKRRTWLLVWEDILDKTRGFESWIMLSFETFFFPVSWMHSFKWLPSSFTLLCNPFLCVDKTVAKSGKVSTILLTSFDLLFSLFGDKIYFWKKSIKSSSAKTEANDVLPLPRLYLTKNIVFRLKDRNAVKVLYKQDALTIHTRNMFRILIWKRKRTNMTQTKRNTEKIVRKTGSV